MSRKEIDLSLPEKLEEQLNKVLDQFTPYAVFNAAAYTQVDHAETEKDLVFKVNAESPGVISQWCANRDIPFIHYSTDYVFSGRGNRPWTELDYPEPLNVYGQSKLAGELKVASVGGRWLIFRTSWIFDA